MHVPVGKRASTGNVDWAKQTACEWSGRMMCARMLKDRRSSWCSATMGEFAQRYQYERSEYKVNAAVLVGSLLPQIGEL